MNKENLKRLGAPLFVFLITMTLAACGSSGGSSGGSNSGDSGTETGNTVILKDISYSSGNISEYSTLTMPMVRGQ